MSSPLLLPRGSSPSSNVQAPSPLATAPSVSITSVEGPSNESVVAHSSSPCQSNDLCRQGPAVVAGVATAGAFFIAACADVGIWVFARRAKALEKCDNLVAASETVKTPREFNYRELSITTRDFDQSRIIGHGAFGTVYKGIIPKHRQGRSSSRSFIIDSLRHRNLVRLHGWCHEKGEILLVYDYMLNKSLDKALFEPKTPPLAWCH